MKALLLIFFCLGLFRCTSEKDLTQNPILIVDSTPYSLSDFTKDLATRLSQQNLLSSKNPSVIQVSKNRLLSDFIIKYLIFEDLKSQKIDVTDDEVDKALNQFKLAYQTSLNFKEELVNANLSESQFRDTLASELRIKKFFSNIQMKIQQPSDSDCLEFYNRNKGEYYIPTRVYLRQIVLKHKHQADDIIEVLKKNPNDFNQLAEKFSIGPESLRQGLIGWVEEGQMSLFDPAFKLKPGKHSKIYESPFGFHIFKVDQKEPKKQLQFAEVKEKILAILIAEQEQGLFLKWLDERLRKIKIQKDDKLMNALIVETKGE